MQIGTEFVLRIHPGGLSSSGRGTIHGPIWCEHGAAAFPGLAWNDFPVVVLGWWLEAVGILLDGRSRSATVHFMDGPYKVHLYAGHREWWRAEWVKEGADGAEVVNQFEFPNESLVRSLTVCSDNLLLECTANGWKSADIDSVVSLRERLLRVGGGTRAVN